MLKIKLTPTGKKNAIHYRIVVAEENTKLTGNFIALLGHFHPTTREFALDKVAYQSWLSKGAAPTPKVKKLASKTWKTS